MSFDACNVKTTIVVYIQRCTLHHYMDISVYYNSIKLCMENNIGKWAPVSVFLLVDIFWCHDYSVEVFWMHATAILQTTVQIWVVQFMLRWEDSLTLFTIFWCIFVVYATLGSVFYCMWIYSLVSNNINLVSRRKLPQRAFSMEEFIIFQSLADLTSLQWTAPWILTCVK